jgi:hypothetical protein
MDIVVNPLWKPETTVPVQLQPPANSAETNFDVEQRGTVEAVARSQPGTTKDVISPMCNLDQTSITARNNYTTVDSNDSDVGTDIGDASKSTDQKIPAALSRLRILLRFIQATVAIASGITALVFGALVACVFLTPLYVDMFVLVSFVLLWLPDRTAMCVGVCIDVVWLPIVLIFACIFFVFDRGSEFFLVSWDQFRNVLANMSFTQWHSLLPLFMRTLLAIYIIEQAE